MRFDCIRKPGLAPYLLAGVLTVGSLVLARPALAAEFESGFFLGAGYGNPREKSDIDVPKNTNTGLRKGFVGYQFQDYLGAEVGYDSFDNLQRNRRDLGSGLTQHFDIKGYYARIYGQLPIMHRPKETVALYVAGGGIRWDLVEEQKQDTITTASKRTHDFATMVATGVSYRTRDAQFRVEFEFFKGIDFIDTFGSTNSIDISVIQFNLMFFL